METAKAHAARRYIVALVVVLLTVAGAMLLTASQAEAATEGDLSAGGIATQESAYGMHKAEAFELGGVGSSKTYAAKYGETFIPIKSTAAGYAYVKVTVAGAQVGSSVESVYYDYDNASGKPAGGGMASGSVDESDPNWSITCGFGGAKAIDSMLYLDVEPAAGAATEGSPLSVTVETSAFYPLVEKGRTVKPKETVEVSQSPGKLYWKVRLTSPRVVLLTSDSGSSNVSLCNSKKKALQPDLRLSGTTADGGSRYRYILNKGTYYVRTEARSFSAVSKTVFAYQTSKIGAPIGKNTKLKKARTIKLGKKTVGVVSTVPKVKKHYYKLVVPSTRKVSATYSNQYAGLVSVALHDSAGKYLTTLEPGKGKSGRFSFEGGRIDELAPSTKRSATLSAGVYYVVVDNAGAGDYGTYSFTIK